jgi:2-polyprenyl-3-methyl-5-hydroxy-6-metoxy-1,4-benzoquinol methylase/GNAT superfamily N-acetyltransferase
MYQYKWIPGGLAPPELIEQMADLYSTQYGIWGDRGRRPGQPIRLTPEQIRENWLSARQSRIVWATAFGQLIGYAIAVQTPLLGYGMVSWVTQLVVHEEHRRSDVGKTLLFTIWQFTDHFAWGLMTANPYAVRALEKATRRRCSPAHIAKHRDVIVKLGIEVVPYVKRSTEIVLNARESRMNTAFFLDHSGLQEMLLSVEGPNKPWLMGPLQEGWEWFAFTFRDQEQIELARKELEQMLLASDAVTKHAYSRMVGEHPWAKHTPAEVRFVMENCMVRRGSSVLDFGCGTGRHAIGLASLGVNVTGIDYLEPFISAARREAFSRSLGSATFEIADCRDVVLAESFDAGICLYDVVGSYADDQDNFQILKNLVRHIRPGGYVLLSVMNMELTERRAKNWFSIDSEPDKLLTLPPSNTMEKTGDVFDPDCYLIDRETRVVYRKEQFTEGNNLPEELLVRDRRYTQDQIKRSCQQAGLDIVWSRFVRAGRWHEPLARLDDHAKEILVLCRRPVPDTEMLFS